MNSPEHASETWVRQLTGLTGEPGTLSRAAAYTMLAGTKALPPNPNCQSIRRLKSRVSAPVELGGRAITTDAQPNHNPATR